MVSAIVLAAGLSTRMKGTNKLILPYRDKTIVVTVVEELLASGIQDVIIVLGHEKDKVRELLKSYPVRFISNPEYALGMTTSIQKGISIASGKGYMICLADMVKIEAEEYAYLNEEFDQLIALHPKVICQPIYNDQIGNPVIFSSNFKDEILMQKEMDGCKKIVRNNLEHVYKISMHHDHILSDIDVEEDYKNLLQ